MEGIKDALGRLSELNEAELSDLESQIVSEFESVEAQELTQQIVDSMTELADALEAVRTEQGLRSEKQQELQAAAEAAASRIRPPEAEAADMDEEEGDEEPAADEAPTDEDEEETPVPVFSSESKNETTASVKTEPAAEASVEEAAAEEAPAEEQPAELAAEAPETEEAAPTEAATEAAEAAVETVAEETAPESEAAAEDVTPTENKQEETAVAASAADVTVESTKSAAPAPILASAKVTVTAGADIAGVTAGSEFADKAAFTEAMTKRLHALRRVTGGDGERHVVASIHAEYPEDRTLYTGDQANWSKIQAVTGDTALVASAGCAPLETQYTIFGVGETDRPVRDALPKFNADRGGLRYYPGASLSQIPTDGTGPIGIWEVGGTVTAADGTTDLSGVKPSFTISCPSVEEVTVEAVSTSLTFNNLTSRAFPELVESNTDLTMVQHARVCEQKLLGGLADATQAAVTATAAPDFSVGSAREFLVQLDLVAGAYRYKHRLSDNQSLRVFAPYWLRDMFRADLAMQSPGDGLEALSVTDALISEGVRRRNINITWSMESVATAPTPGLAAFPATVEWDIFAEGTWLYLDGGSLDLGVIRDSTLVGANDYMEFAEEFFALAPVGNDSWHVTSTLDVAGVAAAYFQDTFS